LVGFSFFYSDFNDQLAMRNELPSSQGCIPDSIYRRVVWQIWNWFLTEKVRVLKSELEQIARGHDLVAKLSKICLHADWWEPVVGRHRGAMKQVLIRYCFRFQTRRQTISLELATIRDVIDYDLDLAIELAVCQAGAVLPLRSSNRTKVQPMDCQHLWADLSSLSAARACANGA
jgi:hypothetical protein